MEKTPKANQTVSDKDKTRDDGAGGPVLAD
jgi:hypothetical protein